MRNSERPILVDVRPMTLRVQGIIPGALYASPAEAETALAHLSRDIEIIVYCSCPNEVSAAAAARHLKTFGFTRIRPSTGGYEAWVEGGHPVDVHAG